MKSKKAAFFTFITIIMLSVLFTTILIQTKPKQSEMNKTINTKVTALNSFSASVEEDISRGVYIAGYRAVLAAQEEVFSSKSFLNNSAANIIEAIMNGTIQGKEQGLMNQSTLPEWLAKIKTEASKSNINVNFSFESITISHENSWNVQYKAEVSFNITDFTKTATFYKNKSIIVEVSIKGFEDPLYTIFTNGKITRIINETPYEGNYTSGFDTGNLKSHIDGYYFANSTGPNFLMRLEGNMSNSTTGIESIVRLPDLEAKGIPVYELSSVDYVYFSNKTDTIYTINQTYEDWLRIDEGHLEKYQVEGLTT